MRVDVGPGVLDLAELQENIGHDLVHVGHELEHGVVGHLLEGELALTRVAGVSLTKHGVTVARHNLEEQTVEWVQF